MTTRLLNDSNLQLIRRNLRIVKQLYPHIERTRIKVLTDLTGQFDLSIETGDLQVVNNNWYVTHTGLLRLARRKRCRGIHVEAVDSLCDLAASRFVLKATVYPSKSSAGFVGYGDADPSNVSLLVRGAEMRIAETRAVNRALRKAYGIGICSFEELGSTANGKPSSQPVTSIPSPMSHSNNGQPKLRDQLCVLIRQHNLDPTLVKA